MVQKRTQFGVVPRLAKIRKSMPGKIVPWCAGWPGLNPLSKPGLPIFIYEGAGYGCESCWG